MRRREFLKRSAGAAFFPLVLQQSAWCAKVSAPSERINIVMTGVGHQAMFANLKPFLASDEAQVVGVCDVDGRRMYRAKSQVERWYGRARRAGVYKGCKEYRDFRDVLADESVDAVMITTPDHWHALMAIAAAKAGKDVCCEKPLTLSIAEGRAICDAVKRYGCVFRTDSEFRSLANFRRACELVRNGRIGKLQRIYTTVPALAASCGPQPVMPVPEELDYDMWLGPAPEAPYTQRRVHNPHGYADYGHGSPGWMWITDYCDGVVVNWGVHLNDIVQCAHGSDLSGPVEAEGHGVRPRDGLFDVLSSFEIRYRYADGVEVFYKTAGWGTARFEGTKGWVQADYPSMELKAEPASLLDCVTGPEEFHLPVREDKEDFIYSVKRRVETMEPAEVGHRTTTFCHLGHIAVKLGRKVRWDPVKEEFVNDDEANKMRHRSMRSPWRL